MVIDTSALVAILSNEPERPALVEKLVASDERLVAAPTLLETAIVVDARFGIAGGYELDQLCRVARISAVPFDEALYGLARSAYRRYGKGRHPAGLNFGDCMSYALAISRGDVLLFKGSDFSQTDVLFAA